MRFTQVVPIPLRSDRLQVGFYIADRTATGSRAPSSSPRSGRHHYRLALAGLDHDEARAVDGQLEGLARAAPNEGPHLEAALDLRLQVCRTADRRLRVNEGRLLRVVRSIGGPSEDMAATPSP